MSSVDGALLGTRYLGAGSLLSVIFVFLVATTVVDFLLPKEPIVTATFIVVAVAATTAEATNSTASTVVEPSASAVQVVASVDASFCLEFCVSSFVVVSAH